MYGLKLAENETYASYKEEMAVSGVATPDTEESGDTELGDELVLPLSKLTVSEGRDVAMAGLEETFEDMVE